MKYKLQDFIDSERINILLDLFHKTTGFLTAILDLEGNVLSKSGWREICTDFHRVNPKTCKKCFVSDTILSGQMAEGEKYHSYECLNGLVDVAVPIIIDGEHLGNLFTGQFLFNEPDLDFFRNQAIECGFHEETYMKALQKVPIVSEEDAKNAMDFMLNMTLQFCDITKQKMERKKSEESFNKSQELLRATGKIAKVGGWEIDLSTQYLTWTEELYHIHQVEKGFQPTVEKAIDFYAPDSKPIILTAVERAIKYGEKFDLELQIVTAKGNILDVHAVGESLSEEGKVVKVLGTFHDITVRKKAEEQLTNYQENLEYIIKERTLELEEKNKKLDELNKVFVGRELRMAELKKEIENLKDKFKP